MKLTRILLEGPLAYDSEYNKAVDAIKAKGGVYLGSGDYGSVFQVGDRAVKVTTDEIELEHAEILKGKQTSHFVHIYDVEVIHPKLGVITMADMEPYKGTISDEFLDDLEQEATQLGIDPEELDIRPDNFMIDPQTGKLKMTDV